MFIKVIKKNRNKVKNNATNQLHKEKQTAPKSEKKIEQTIMRWISEVREKKVFEFSQPNFLSNKTS